MSFHFVSKIILSTICFLLLSFTAKAQQNPPQPPVAVGDSFTVHGQTYFNVLVNDSFSTAHGAYAVRLSSPAQGMMTNSSTPGGFTYTPASGFTGEDGFTYKTCLYLTEPAICSGSASVMLTVVNQPPIAVDDYYIVRGTVDLNSPHPTHNDSDPDNDPLTERRALSSPVRGNTNNGWWGNFAYTANDRSYTGYDSFEWQTGDNLGLWSNISTVSLILIGDGAEDAGEGCPMQRVGEPVNVTNGNMYLEQTDYNLPGSGENIVINRFYNSIIQTSGLFGFGWSTKYDESLWLYDDKMIRLNMPDGRAVYFGRKNTIDAFTAVSPEIYGQILKNADNTYTLTFKDGRIHKFSAGGRLLWQKDRNGNQTTLTYDGNGNLSGITDAFGRTLTVTPNANGTVSNMSDSIGTVATYEYFPGTTRLKTVTYNDGSKYKYEYTTINNKTYLTTVKDALDNILETHQYDSSGRATTSEKHGGVEKYTLNYSNTTYTTVTDALGRVTKYYFDKSKARNVITKTEGNCNCGSGSQVTQYFYDYKLNLTKKVDALGRETVYTYDTSGNHLSMTDTLGTETYTYNSFGEVLTRTDRMNGVTTNTYSTTGNLLTTKDALNNTTTLTYTTLGQLATVKDARNNITTLIYDSFGRLTQVKDANNKTTDYVYDARARLTSTTNALNQTTNFQYDLNNRLKKIIYADTNFEEYTYDLAGRRTQAKDARGNTTTFGYDNAYRLISVTDALNHTTTFGYDLMSNRISQTDALGNVTNYEYDEFNRLKKVKYPLSVTGATQLEERTEYDTVGNIKKRIDTANRETLYDYDTANRLIKTTDALMQITQFEYNARSQMTKVKDALNQEYVFAYDALGRQLSQTRAGATMSYVYNAVGNRTKRTDYLGRETSYEYDVLNRLKKINYLQSFEGNIVPTPIQMATYNYDDLSRLTSATNEAGTVSFIYDNRGRVSSTTDVFGHVLNYAYDANGNRTQLKLDGAVHTAYAYDAANRLTTLTDEASQNFTFGYDVANKIIAKTLPNGVSSTFEYDGMSRLTNLKHQSAAGILSNNEYGYNQANQILYYNGSAGNKTFNYDNTDRLTGMIDGWANETYAYDGVGNRTSSHKSSTYGYQPNNKLTSTQGANYSYDANGNLLMTKYASGYWMIYGWDYENRMTTARNRNKILRYQYDALGRRVSRSGKTLGATKYTYDGLDVVMDDDFNKGIVKYQNGLGIDDKLKMVANGQANYFQQDHLGSTIRLTDQNGSTSSSLRYDSFGKAEGLVTTRYQFTGREYDDFTGLYFYRARWYDAELGRFISEDPIGFAGGDVNLFGYVGNNPANKVDPMGETEEGMMARMQYHQDPATREYVAIWDSCLSKCLLTYGIGEVVGFGGFVFGQPMSAKRFVTSGSSPGTSPISQGLSKMFPQKLPFRVPTPTWERPFAESNKFGRVLGRWTPIIGAGMMIGDFFVIRSCANKCYDGACSN